MNVKPRTANSPNEDPVGESIKRRVARWDAKYNPERLAAVLAAKGERMHERYAVQAEMLGRVDHRVSEVTDAAGVSVITRMWFKPGLYRIAPHSYEAGTVPGFPLSPVCSLR
ncbi:MAG: hypothetical protein NTX53_01460 [candidate division WOR-3 bacterium]|nr:hypothetical protein [candidate division WOR-3 bacterium]